MLCFFFYSLLSVREMLKKHFLLQKTCLVIFFVVLYIRIAVIIHNITICLIVTRYFPRLLSDCCPIVVRLKNEQQTDMKRA